MRATLTAVGLAVIVAVGSNTYAQSSDAGAQNAPASMMSAKATKQADRHLGLAVRHALAKREHLDVSNIFVRARNGAVILSGTVPDGRQIGLAEEAAKEVPGVKAVTNRLALAPQSGS